MTPREIEDAFKRIMRYQAQRKRTMHAEGRFNLADSILDLIACTDKSARALLKRKGFRRLNLKPRITTMRDGSREGRDPFKPPADSSPEVRKCFLTLEYGDWIRRTLKPPETGRCLPELNRSLSGAEVDAVLARVSAVRQPDVEWGMLTAFRLGLLLKEQNPILAEKLAEQIDEKRAQMVGLNRKSARARRKKRSNRAIKFWAAVEELWRDHPTKTFHEIVTYIPRDEAPARSLLKRFRIKIATAYRYVSPELRCGHSFPAD